MYIHIYIYYHHTVCRYIEVLYRFILSQRDATQCLFFFVRCIVSILEEGKKVTWFLLH